MTPTLTLQRDNYRQKNWQGKHQKVNAELDDRIMGNMFFSRLANFV